MRVGKGVALGFLLAGMCTTRAGPEMPPFEVDSTYRTWVREDLPSPAGTGDAPLAGSLGPPLKMVEPEFPGVTTRTREGSSGPPVRSGGAEPTAEVRPIEFRGPDPDGWRAPRGPRGRRDRGEEDDPGKPAEGETDH